MRSRAGFLAGVLMVAGLLGGVTANSVTAATSTTVTWKVSSLTVKATTNLSDIASSNSPGKKTWSKSGSCTLTPVSKPTKLIMGSTGACRLTLKIAQSGQYSAKSSSKTILREGFKVNGYTIRHNANLTGANLWDANLTGANLEYATLTGANLQYANLWDATLWNADLTGANLTGANLTRANLTRAKLYSAILAVADLTRANLTGANLTYANLTGANLTRANLPDGWQDIVTAY